MDKSDNEILLQLKRNDVNGLKRLYDKYYENLYMLAVKYTGQKEVAEEIIQDFILNMFRSS